MFRRVAILQSDYIPWKGYFDIIGMVDVFVLYDDVQFTRRDWRNRNLVKGPNGVFWLTIPVHTKARFTQKICEAIVADHSWADRHWRSLELSYKNAEGFSEVSPVLRKAYEELSSVQMLSHINQEFIRTVSAFLGIQTEIIPSQRFRTSGSKTERLLQICLELGAQEYVCGPASRNYLDERLFLEAGLGIKYLEYDNYPAYQQLWGPFVHNVSIVDLLLNTGRHAAKYMKYLGDRDCKGGLWL